MTCKCPSARGHPPHRHGSPPFSQKSAITNRSDSRRAPSFTSRSSVHLRSLRRIDDAQLGWLGRPSTPSPLLGQLEHGWDDVREEGGGEGIGAQARCPKTPKGVVGFGGEGQPPALGSWGGSLQGGKFSLGCLRFLTSSRGPGGGLIPEPQRSSFIECPRPLPAIPWRKGDRPRCKRNRRNMTPGSRGVPVLAPISGGVGIQRTWVHPVGMRSDRRTSILFRPGGLISTLGVKGPRRLDLARKLRPRHTHPRPRFPSWRSRTLKAIEGP